VGLGECGSDRACGACGAEGRWPRRRAGICSRECDWRGMEPARM
jgi:hypothetical protein